MIEVIEEGRIPFDEILPVPNLPPPTVHDHQRAIPEAAPLTRPGRNLQSEYVAELMAQDIIVDDNYEPDQLNAKDLGPQPIGVWGKSAACCCASQGHLKLGGR